MPGPACVPTTGPSGRPHLDLRPRRLVSPDHPPRAHRGGLAPRMRDSDPGRVAEPSTNARSNSRYAFCAPRTFFSGKTSPSASGGSALVEQRPASAEALPMRPPLARCSSVSTVKISTLSLANAPPKHPPPRRSWPRSSRRWIASASMAIAARRASESIVALARRPPRPPRSALVRPGQPPREVNGEHALVRAELRVRGQEVGGGGL